MEVLNLIRRLRLREKLSLHEIARRTFLSRNTVKKYLKAEIIEPKFDASNRTSKLDPFAEKLAAWPKSEAAKPSTEMHERWRAGRVIADELPVCVRAALEAKADGFDKGREGGRDCQGCDRCQQAEEAHPRCLKSCQADPGHEGEAAQTRGIAAPAGRDCLPEVPSL
jgi:transcriptional regulator with XRE-family HTH domain